VNELAALLGEIGDCKRVRAAHFDGSVAERRFLGAWTALAAGAEVREVAVREAAGAVAAARLGAIDAELLQSAGTSQEAAHAVLERSFDEVAGAVPEPLRGELREALREPRPGEGSDAPAPSWVRSLARQPRAGATRPGHARVMLQPEESHAEHCWAVAVGAVLAAPGCGAELEGPFLCGLAHHLHNALLPDAGFVGEAMLGEELELLLARLTGAALADLAAALQSRVRTALVLRDAAESPEARAFHTADVLDRVLEMRHHARSAAFTVDQALEELELVHEGPTQAFGLAVLEEAGLR